MKTMDVVELPKDLEVYRSTGVSVITFSNKKELAKKFVEFLVSDEGIRIYKEFGWSSTKLSSA